MHFTHCSKKCLLGHCDGLIVKRLRDMEENALCFRNHFWDRLKAWNKIMVTQFTPSWVSCLDESMSTWMNKYTSWVDVHANEAMALWQSVPHSVLLIVRHSLAAGVGRGEGCTLNNHPEIQQSRKKQLDCCFKCWSPSLEGAMLWSWTLDFAS